MPFKGFIFRFEIKFPCASAGVNTIAFVSNGVISFSMVVSDSFPQEAKKREIKSRMNCFINKIYKENQTKNSFIFTLVNNQLSKDIHAKKFMLILL